MRIVSVGDIRECEGASGPSIHVETGRAGDEDVRPTVAPPQAVVISRSPDTAWNALPAVAVERESDRGGRSVLLSFLAWTLAGLFFIWLYCQLLPMFRLVLEYDGWRFYAALALVLVPVVVLLALLLRAALVFRRLPPVRQMVEGKERGIDLKRKLQSRYLAKLPPSAEYVSRCAFRDPDQVRTLLDGLRAKESLHSDETGWLEDFRRFQSCQETRAREIVGKYCKLIALKTAASPWKLLDMACVFYNSTRMVCDIATLFNRRISRGSAFRLVCRWCAAIYVSGELGSIMESVSSAGGEKIADMLAESDLLPGVAQSMPILSRIAGKTIEGGVNAYFAYRMGKRAIEYFRALSKA